MKFFYSKLFSSRESYGFTLIEILVAIAILATLAGGVFITLNPATQIDRARDAVSQRGLNELRTALDTYYADHGCYPRAQSVFTTALNTGSAWREGTTTYINEAPLDGYGQPYIYITDPTSDCPQWYSIFSRLRATANSGNCPLAQDSACVPVGFDDSWACVMGGITNCGLLASTVVNGSVIGYPTPTPLPDGSTPLPPTGEQTFSISMPAFYLPQFFRGRISSTNPPQNSEVTLSINTDGHPNPFPVSSVTATIQTDNQTSNHSMFLSSGNAQNGGWSTTWLHNDTVNHTFIITLNATDSNGNQSSVDVVVR